MEDASLYKKILNAMSSHIAILDENGNIVETNRAWQEFGSSNGLEVANGCLHCNYLEACEAGNGETEDDGVKVAVGIRRVIAGEIDEFLMQYPCHSPEEQHWFVVRVVLYRDEQLRRVIVSHEDITPIVEVQKTLEKKEEQLERQAEKLQETNIALRVLLDQRNEDRKHMESAVFANIDRLVLPYLEKLNVSRLTQSQKTLVEIISSNLEDIISPFLRRLSTLEMRLTPQEMEVANLIRNGRSSKEIAEVLFLSVAGVDFHRKNLRKKLGLTNSGQNLRSYLMSLE